MNPLSPSSPFFEAPLSAAIALLWNQHHAVIADNPVLVFTKPLPEAQRINPFTGTSDQGRGNRIEGVEQPRP